MRFFRRRPKGRGSGNDTSDRAAANLDKDHLEHFITTRKGVEGFVEPRTTVTETTLLLVAIDGEWTRRRVPSPAWAHEFANKRGVPSYDAGVVGVPQRMRDWNRRQAQARKESGG